MTGAQATAQVLLYLFVWGGFAVLFGVAIGKSIVEADRRGKHTTPPADEPVVELGTRLDVRL